jgi:hypothetical protein
VPLSCPFLDTHVSNTCPTIQGFAKATDVKKSKQRLLQRSSPLKFPLRLSFYTGLLQALAKHIFRVDIVQVLQEDM